MEVQNNQALAVKTAQKKNTVNYTHKINIANFHGAQDLHKQSTTHLKLTIHSMSPQQRKSLLKHHTVTVISTITESTTLSL